MALLKDVWPEARPNPSLTPDPTTGRKFATELPSLKTVVPKQSCPACHKHVGITANDGGSLICSCDAMGHNLFHWCCSANPAARTVNGHYIAFGSPGPGLCSYCTKQPARRVW